MDNKNVFVAIALSMSVLLFWGAFFETPKKPIEQKNDQKVEQKSEQSSIAPTIDQPTVIKNISREDSVNKSKRVKIENNSIIGSINLKGAQIDDISFKNHKQEVDGNKNIIFLNPAETENGFYIETWGLNLICNPFSLYYINYFLKLHIMKLRQTIFVLLIILVGSCQTDISILQSVGISEDSLNVATKRLHKYVDEGKLPGTYVKIIKDGKVVYDDKYGFIDIDKKKPIEENSLYRIFSMTKPITAVAIMSLYDQGKLNLDDKVSKYIPEFLDTQVYKDLDGKHSFEPQKTPLTIRHLLTHTSGIPYGWESSYTDSIYNVRQHMRKDWTLEEMIKDIATIPLKFQPGTKYNYGLGIDIAGYIVEVVSGEKLNNYFKTVIFDPLKMNDTRFYIPEEKREQLSELYTMDENGKLIIVSDPNMEKVFGSAKPPRLLLGGAGLISTLNDYETFCRMLLNKGELNGKRILSEKAAEMIMTNQYPKEMKTNSQMGHGLSGMVNLDTGEYNWGGAAATSFWINPKDNLILICYTQLFGSPTSYATDFKATLDQALFDSALK